MKKSNKAWLLSAFVFPGSGYFVIRQPVKGLLVLAISVLCLYIVIANTQAKIQGMRPIINDIMSGKMAADADAIQHKLNSIEGPYAQNTHIIALWVLGILWIGSSVDCYRIGKKSRVDQTKNQDI